ncbi:MAG: divalent-cation tolerance protein CutA [Verrucomicrobia bacterium]|nr:divalent-cation tolerance protein CutA [Verrucomicrobiota bacterium]
MEVLVVTCTFPDHEIGWRISRAAVENGLAACATLIPEAKSIYRWKGRIETANETAACFKTTRDRFEALRTFILKEHPYEVPELVAWTVSDGSPEYLAWVEASTRRRK